MAFTYTNGVGCNANTVNSYNTSLIDKGKRVRAAHINELRKAIEEFRTNHTVSSVVSWTASGTGMTIGTKVRTPDLNELRTSVNKIRQLLYRCTCNSNGCCNCHSIGGCWMGGVCNPQWFQYYSTTMGNYAFSTLSGDTSGAGTRLTTGVISKNHINTIRDAVGEYNNHPSWYNYNQSF